MRKVIYSLLFASLSLISCSHEEKSDLEELGLLGKVKYVTTVSYDAYDKFGEGSLQKAKPSYVTAYISSFDSLGNLIMEKSLSITDVKRKYTTVYNNNNQRTKWMSYDDDDDTKMRYGEISYFDDKNNLVKELDLKDNSVTNYKNTYNNEGQIISQIGGSYKRFWEYENGKLVKFTENFYDMITVQYFKDGLVFKDTRDTDVYWTYTYDELKRRIESTMYQNENIKKKHKNIYADKNGQAPIESIEWNADGAIEHDNVFTYFVVGNDTVTIFTYDKEELKGIDFYSKDTQGTTNDTYYSSSSLSSGYQYIYENGALISRRDLKKGDEHKYIDGILTITEKNKEEITEEKYKRNNLISRITKDKTGKVTYSYVVEGDESKKTITIIDNGETKIGEEIYEDGKLVKFTEAYNGLTSSVSYDKDGHLSEIKNSDGTVWSYKYEYDSHGNWVRQITYKNSKPNQITERSIVYYD